jgi:hypothetical protein
MQWSVLWLTKARMGAVEDIEDAKHPGAIFSRNPPKSADRELKRAM